MGKLTTHVLDLHAGTPAAGVRIELHAMDAVVPELLGSTETNGDGRCSSPLLEGDTMKAGRYRLSFHVADYYRARNVPLPTPPFIDVAVICFGIAAPAENYHVPLLVSPWSYSTYRGS